MQQKPNSDDSKSNGKINNLGSCKDEELPEYLQPMILINASGCNIANLNLIGYKLLVTQLPIKDATSLSSKDSGNARAGNIRLDAFKEVSATSIQ